MQEVSAKGSVSDTQGNYICIGNVGDEVILKLLVILLTRVIVYLVGPTIVGSLTTAKEVEKILCTHCRNCKLGVLNRNLVLIFKPLCKQVRISAFTVSSVALNELTSRNIALNITIKAISVRHRVTYGYIVNLVFLGFVGVVIVCPGSCADCSCANAEQHGNNHYQRNQFETNLS